MVIVNHIWVEFKTLEAGTIAETRAGDQWPVQTRDSQTMRENEDKQWLIKKHTHATYMQILRCDDLRFTKKLDQTIND